MAPVADRTRFRLKFTKKYAPLEHFGSGLVYHADMSDAKNSEGGGEDLDFNIFSAPIPETLPRASWRSRSKAGVKGTYKNDVAVAERDNRKALKRT